MTAAFDVMLDYGGTTANPGSNDTISNMRFRTDDVNTQDTTNPVPSVSGETRYSAWRHVYLECTTIPATKVDNIKFYCDGGGFGTGIAVFVGDEFPTKNAATSSGYERATDHLTTGENCSELSAGHGGITGVTDLFTNYPTASPMSGPSISEASSLIDATGETTNYLVLQARVLDTASSGTKSAETWTFQYDEI